MNQKARQSPLYHPLLHQALVLADLVQPSVLMQDNLRQGRSGGGWAQDREMEHMGHGHQLTELWPRAKIVLLLFFFCPSPVPWDKKWLI